MSELHALQKEKWVNIEVGISIRPTDLRWMAEYRQQADNLFRWKMALMVINPDSVFNGGYFRVRAIPRLPHDTNKGSWAATNHAQRPR